MKAIKEYVQTVTAALIEEQDNAFRGVPLAPYSTYVKRCIASTDIYRCRMDNLRLAELLCLNAVNDSELWELLESDKSDSLLSMYCRDILCIASKALRQQSLKLIG